MTRAGTGKTYLSAFDVRNVKPTKLLFLAHREQLLKQALDSFKDVLGESLEAGILSGNNENYKADCLFSTIQMMSKENVYNKFNSEYFDYLIIDETHRAGAESYNRIINYFKPKFLLGMTATPDRMDDFNIYELFDYNIAYEIRLQDAMREEMLCPFHYFGITDMFVDGEAISELSEFSKLVTDVRVDYILEKLKFYGYSGERVKGLVFCSRNEEALELSKKFNQRGFQTLSLSGNNTIEQREIAISRLVQSEREDGLDYILQSTNFCYI